MADLENVVFLATADCLAVSAECPGPTPEERRLLELTLLRLRDLACLLTEVLEDANGRGYAGTGIGSDQPARRIRSKTA